MITVAIVAILASVALPGYQSQIKKTRRADAQGALMGFGNAMERFFTEKNTYLGAAGSSTTPANTGAPWIFKSEAPLDGSTKYYDLTISDATATSYELRAIPKGSQNGDGFLQLKSSGERAWDKNNDNAIVDAEKSW